MKKLLALMLSIVILILSVGFFRGWFSLSSSDTGVEGHQTNVNLTVDKDKMREDAATVKRKSTELKDEVIGKEKTPNAP
jgi:hypothetical protein